MRRICLVAFAAATLCAQPSKQLEQIQNKLDRILKILEEADAPPPPVKVDVAGFPVIGDDKAPITIVEFTDMQCPYCAKFHADTFPALRDAYISTGKVRFVSRDLPLPMHKFAMQAAIAARCAGDQSKFWEMRDRMQSNPSTLELEDLQSHAGKLELNLDQYQACMSSGKYRIALEAEIKQAQQMNITGTPTFVIGKSGAMIEGQVITGAQPLAAFEKAILAVK